MSQDRQQRAASSLAEPPWRGGRGRDVLTQLQLTRQWEADGSHLLRPASFHAWAAADREGPQ